MALNSRIVCLKCKQQKYVIHGAQSKPLICHDCLRTEADAKKAEHLSDLAKLPVEERLRQVEEWIYDYRPYTEPRF